MARRSDAPEPDASARSTARATADDATPTGSDATAPAANIALSPMGWVRFLWRQLTSMRTAIVLLLMLALAAVPGSMVPQRTSDPNGVVQFEMNDPDLFQLYDTLQLFNVYSSVWFSAIYILLFVSLIGCIIPRTKHHWDALRATPPKTPARLARLTGFRTVPGDATDIDRAETVLKGLGYRTARYGDSVSAERGYLRETGNLVFHVSLLGILVTVAIGSGFGYTGQRLVVEGEAYSNALSSMDSFSPGTFFDPDNLQPYAITLDELDVVYEEQNPNAYGTPIDFTAFVTLTTPDGTSQERVRVNEPLRVGGDDVFLLSNGYAPIITIRDPDGNVVFSRAVPFLAQDNMLTSVGVLKLPDQLEEQLGLQGFFYPTAVQLESGAYASMYPDLIYPMLSLNAYTGDLGLDAGVPRSVYVLDTSEMTQVAGGHAGEPLLLLPGDTVDLPNDLGTITFEGVVRYAVFDIHHDPTQEGVLVFAIVLVLSLLVSLFIPRRRVWVKATAGGVLEIAGLARGEDPGLDDAVGAVAAKLAPDAEPDADDDDPDDDEPDAEDPDADDPGSELPTEQPAADDSSAESRASGDDPPARDGGRDG